MKKVVLSFSLCCFIINIVAQTSIYRDNDFRFLGVEEVKSYNLYGKKNNPSCNLRINFFYPHTAINKELQTKLQSYFIEEFFGAEYASMTPEKATKAYSKNYLENYKETFEKSGLYKLDEKNAKAKGETVNDFGYHYNFDKTMRNTIKFNKGSIVSQVINVTEYEGGPHASSYTKGLVYDIETGKNISYQDIFYNDVEDKISELITKSLMEERMFANEEVMIDLGFTTTQIPPSDNFIANDKGITFIYNRYDVGSFALSLIDIFVPYSELYVYMKPECSLFRWANLYYAGNRIKYDTSYLNEEFYAYDREKFPGFVCKMQFTYPKAYRDQVTLENLQKLFITNGLGEVYSEFTPEEALRLFYSKMLSEYDDFTSSRETQKMVSEIEQSENNFPQTIMALSKEFTMTNNFYLNNNDLISYTITTYNYDGGAHGMEITKGFTVKLSEAKLIKYSDILIPTSIEGLKPLLVNALLDSKEFENINELKNEGYEINKIVPTNNFYIDEEGITFIYNPYEIGPYSLGTTTIHLPFSDIKKYLTNEYRYE
ncbi:hypothetical protein M2138_000028 [Dysgonomonadaceae bacterium PH5-43]|nr:hypothetical protein [Dysgonomonadaceae bacterium PH5-43]